MFVQKLNMTDESTLAMAAMARMQKVEGIQNPEKALDYAQRACQLVNASSTENPRYLSTLALAQHQTGDTAAAIETMARALALMPPAHQMRPKFEKELAEYETALAGPEQKTPDDQSFGSAEKGRSDQTPPTDDATDQSNDEAETDTNDTLYTWNAAVSFENAIVD